MEYLRIILPYNRRLWRIGTCQCELRRMRTRLLCTEVGRILSKDTQRSTRKVKMEPPWNVLFFGTDEFAVESLVALHKGRERGLIGKLNVVTVPTKKTSPVQRYCRKENLDIIHWPVEVPDGVYDVGTVVSFGHLLSSKIINSFPLGILNVHGSLLPRWRGAAPIIHAVWNNDKVTGVTVMEIQPFRFDVGKIVSTAEVQISWDTKSGVLTKQLADIGAKELISVLENLPKALEKAIEQSSEGVTKAPKVSEATSRIKWNIYTCKEIQARYRALDDHFPLWTTWHGTSVKLREMKMHRKWTSPSVNERVSENYGAMKKQQTHQNVRSNDLKSGKENAIQTENNVECSDEGNVNIERKPQNSWMMLADIKENQENDTLEDGNFGHTFSSKPGTVIYSKKTKTLSVRCIDNWVSFGKVILKGKKQMSAHEFYNGFIGKVSYELRKFD